MEFIFLHVVHSSVLTAMESVFTGSKPTEAASRVPRLLRLVVSVHVSGLGLD